MGTRLLCSMTDLIKSPVRSAFKWVPINFNETCHGDYHNETARNKLLGRSRAVATTDLEVLSVSIMQTCTPYGLPQWLSHVMIYV